MASSGWHESQSGPDWTDVALQLQEQDKMSGTFTSLLIESAGGTAVGSLYIALTTRRRAGLLESSPTVLVTQAYWPAISHKTFDSFIFFLLFTHGDAVETALRKKEKEEEALRAAVRVHHKNTP